MTTYNYYYIYHKYNAFEKDGKVIEYGTAVLARSDGTPFIVKIRNKDAIKWAAIRDANYDNPGAKYPSVVVHTTYDKYGKIVPEAFVVPKPDSSACLDDEGIPF